MLQIFNMEGLEVEKRENICNLQFRFAEWGF